MNEFSAYNLIFGSGAFSIVILALLALMSFISWGIILHKWKVFRRLRSLNNLFLKNFNAVRSFGELPKICITERVDKKKKIEAPLRNITVEVLKEAHRLPKYVSYDNLHHRAGLLEESLQSGVERQRMSEDLHLSFLSSASNLAPFLGLLGTVWGIMDSLWSIGKHGSADLVVVAPGIGAALVTTIAGLLVAIPASAAHSYFSRIINRNESFYYDYGSRLLSLFKREELSLVESEQHRQE